MGNKVITFDKMQVGSKGGGKHWTKSEVESRRQAAQEVKRAKTKPPRPPEWVKNDLRVFRIWEQVLKDAKGLDLLDSLDANTLATYCKLEAAKQEAIEKNDIETFERLAKTQLPYAKSLGLTPEARARLAKRRADRKREGDPNAALFD